jgi:hypothetical protein
MVGFSQTPLPIDFDFFFRLADSENLKAAFVPRTCVRVIEPPYRTEYVSINGERPRISCFELADVSFLAWPIGELLEYLRFREERPDLLTIGEQAVRIFPKANRPTADYNESPHLM